MRLSYPGLLYAALLATAGCHFEKTTNVTADRRFQCGYLAGQVWVLRTQADLVNFRPTGSDATRSVLIADAKYRRIAGAIRDAEPQLVAAVPAGSTIQIDRLEYSESHDFDPIWVHGPEETKEMLAVGTLRTPTRTWADITAPGHLRAVPNTRTAARVDDVLLTFPDLDIVRLASAVRPDGLAR